MRHKTLRLISAAAAVFVCASAVNAETPNTMPIDFVGDWCFMAHQDNKTWFQLPSWTVDGPCERILSIVTYGFSGEGHHCELAETPHVATEVAPSGTTYVANVTAQCQRDGPDAGSQLNTFEFSRYKGNLWVITK